MAKSRFVACASGAVLAFAMGDSALAQAEPARPEPQAARPADEAADQGTVLGDVIVTALRREERLRDVPVSITAVTSSGLERAGITNLRDLGNITPGLVFTGQAGLASPTIRGIQSTLGQAGAETPTSIYLDGVYQPNIAANIMDIADIEQVEVLKGPQGTLFGRNSTAGAINIRTVNPSFDLRGEVTISDGVYFGGGARTSHDVTAKGYVTGPLAGDWLAGSLSGFYEYVPGYLTNDLNGDRTGRIKKYVVRGKLLIKPSDTFSILLTGLYAHRDDETAFGSQPLNGNTNIAFFSDGVVPRKIWHVASPLRHGVGQLYVTQKSASMKLSWDAGPGVGEFSSLTSYLDIAAQLIVPIAAAHSPTCVSTFKCIIYDDIYPSETFQQELNFTSAKWGRLSLVAGAIYYHDHATIVSDINPPLDAKGDLAGPGPVYLVGVVNTNAIAGFGEASYDLTDRLHLIAGLRYSREKRNGHGNLVARIPSTGPVTNSAWTPRLSARYDLTDRSNVYFTYSKGFKSAVLDSINQTDNVASPEKVTSYEVGVKASLQNLSFNVSAYYYDYRNLQVQFFDGVTTILTNAANAKIYGVEGDVSYRITSELSIQATGSWLAHANYSDFKGGVAFILPNSPDGMRQVVVDASGERMVKTPKFAGSVSLNYSTELSSGHRLDASATYAYVGSYYFDLLKRVDTGGYGTLNGNIGFTPNRSRIRFSVFAKNLTGEKYFTGALLGNQADAPVYAPPRQIGVGANLKF